MLQETAYKESAWAHSEAVLRSAHAALFFGRAGRIEPETTSGLLHIISQNAAACQPLLGGRASGSHFQRAPTRHEAWPFCAPVRRRALSRAFRSSARCLYLTVPRRHPCRTGSRVEVPFRQGLWDQTLGRAVDVPPQCNFPIHRNGSETGVSAHRPRYLRQPSRPHAPC